MGLFHSMATDTTLSTTVKAEALDQKGNRYFIRKLVSREYLGPREDLMCLTFGLPMGVSLRSLGIDAGLGDFVRMRPYAEEHKKLVVNPAGGRAYSPVLHPGVEGKFALIVKAYGPEDGKVVGVSSLLRHIPVGSELLVTNHTEHTFWEERKRGYYCNERNLDDGGDGAYSLCLIAFGIGITEIAPVAMSELLDPRVKQVTILWANKEWSDAEWVWECAGDDLVRQFFSEQGKYGARLQIKHILSREERAEALFHGRINADVLTRAFLQTDTPRERLKFLAVGSTAMIDFAYEQLAALGLDVSKKDSWGGGNLLYRKLAQSSVPADRGVSPLAATKGTCRKRQRDTTDENPSKRPSALRAGRRGALCCWAFCGWV